MEGLSEGSIQKHSNRASCLDFSLDTFHRLCSEVCYQERAEGQAPFEAAAAAAAALCRRFIPSELKPCKFSNHLPFG